MARKKKAEEKGHTIERYGFRISTSPTAAGSWLVTVTPRGKSDGSGTRPPEIDRDTFKFEGEALDWAEDWAQEHRPYTVKVESSDNGFYGQVRDEVGFDHYTSVSCGDAGEARQVAESWVAARRRHDLQVIDARRAARANYRMTLEDLETQESEENATIDAAKGRLKSIEKERDEAKRALRDPQIPFNFVAELERRGALKDAKGKDPRQTDLEEKLDGAANDTPTTRARGAAARARQEAPTPA